LISRRFGILLKSWLPINQYSGIDLDNIISGCGYNDDGAKKVGSVIRTELYDYWKLLFEMSGRLLVVWLK